MTTKRTTSVSSAVRESVGGHKHLTVSFNQIEDPGVYYNHTTGWLYRIPDEGLNPGHSPLMNVLSNEENLLTKISSDPWMPINKAREICSNMDFFINF
jgi:hypothetical protein